MYSYDCSQAARRGNKNNNDKPRGTYSTLTTVHKVRLRGKSHRYGVPQTN